MSPAHGRSASPAVAGECTEAQPRPVTASENARVDVAEWTRLSGIARCVGVRGIQAGSASTPPCGVTPTEGCSTRGRVRSASGPWSHSLPTTRPRFEPVAGWSSSGGRSVQAEHPGRHGPRLSTTGSLRVLSRNCRRGLARNGPLGAAVELPGGCRRRAPTRRSAWRRSEASIGQPAAETRHQNDQRSHSRRCALMRRRVRAASVSPAAAAHPNPSEPNITQRRSGAHSPRTSTSLPHPTAVDEIHIVDA
jgi:hypothetical protein